MMKRVRVVNKILIQMLLISICVINSHAQNMANIDSTFNYIREHDRACLHTYRSCANNLTVIDYKYVSNYGSYGIGLYNDPIINGFDLSPKGLLADSSMQVRILQLLKGEFYEGELDELIKNELKRERYSFLTDSEKLEETIRLETMYRKEPSGWRMKQLLTACQYVDNKQILKRIEEMYKDSTYNYCKKELLVCLISNHVEPYTSTILRKSIYSKSQDETVQFENIKQLAIIHSQNAYKEIANYLLSDAYHINYICDDGKNIKDTILFEEYDVLLDFDEDDSAPSVEERPVYCFEYAFDCIQLGIANDDLYSMLEIINDQAVSLEFLTKETRYKIYNWMQKNYGKYKIKNRW